MQGETEPDTCSRFTGACINFINLNTASSSLRLKEIALRKSVGASRRQLVLQFMSESYILLLVALYLGFFFAEHLAGLYPSLNLDAFSNDARIYVYEPVQEYIFVRVLPGTFAEKLGAINEVFLKYNPGYTLEYDYVRNFDFIILESSDGISLVFKLFSAIATFIAFMGLNGLSQFNNSRRTKEVGIHKVNGAQKASVIHLLLSDFIKLVLISNLVALPLAYLGL